MAVPEKLALDTNDMLFDVGTVYAVTGNCVSLGITEKKRPLVLDTLPALSIALTNKA